MSAELVAEHGLTINDFEALLHLSRADEGRMRRVDLAEKLILTASGVTRLLDGLEEAGFVDRAACASGRRVASARASPASRDRACRAGDAAGPRCERPPTCHTYTPSPPDHPPHPPE